MVPQHIQWLEAKIVEGIEKQMVRRLLWDGKVPGTSAGTRAAAAPGPGPSGTATGVLEERQINSSLPCQTGRIEWHRDGPEWLKSLGGIKTK